MGHPTELSWECATSIRNIPQAAKSSIHSQVITDGQKPVPFGRKSFRSLGRRGPSFRGLFGRGLAVGVAHFAVDFEFFGHENGQLG
jgi:hypothetical protein